MKLYFFWFGIDTTKYIKITATSRIHRNHSAKPSDGYFWTAEQEQGLLSSFSFLPSPVPVSEDNPVGSLKETGFDTTYIVYFFGSAAFFV